MVVSLPLAERHSRPRVCVLVGALDVHRAAVSALRLDGLSTLPTRALSSDASTVAVAGWPGDTPSKQRRESLAAVERLTPRRVVLVTDLRARSDLHRLLATGIHGLVLCDELETVLGVTVRAVGAGQVCVSEHVREALAPRPLSTREREILALVIMGLSNGEIARRLYLAESTVKSHLASTFDKLGVRSRAEAAGLVSDPQHMLSTGIVGLSASVVGRG